MTITTVPRKLFTIAAASLAIAVVAPAIAYPPPATEAPPKAPKTEAAPAAGAAKTEAKKDKFDPARWEKEMAGFDAADKRSPPSPGSTVFTGSSTIRLWTLKESFPGRPFMNRGFGGSVYRDITAWLDKTVLRYDPSRVVLYSGDNDLAAGLSPDEVVADLTKLLDAIHAKLPEAQIIVISVKPSPKRAALKEKAIETNKRFAALVAERDYCKFVNVWDAMLGPNGEYREELYVEDKLHMSKEGYALWAKILDPLF